LPLALPSYVIMQHWHERYTHDPAVRWFRSLIAELFADQSTLGQRKLGVVSPIHESASKIS